MSSIFDDVALSTSRRKAKTLEIPHPKALFLDKVRPVAQNITVIPPEMANASVSVSESKDTNTVLFTTITTPTNPKIDLVWGVCVFFALFPVTHTIYKTFGVKTFSPDMLIVPYECSMFYLGIFFGLPGITVHIFCLSLIFSKICKLGVFLSILSICLMIITVEQACMAQPQVSIDTTFYIFSASTYSGLVSQCLFVSILYRDVPQKMIYTCILGFGAVMVTLSLLAIVLSALNSEIPHTISTIHIRTIPLSIAVIIHGVSTYWTMYPVRIVCNNM